MFYLSSRLVRGSALFNSVPIKGSNFPIFDHHLMALATIAFTFEVILKLPGHFSWRLSGSSSIVPQPLLLKFCFE